VWNGRANRAFSLAFESEWDIYGGEIKPSRTQYSHMLPATDARVAAA